MGIEVSKEMNFWTKEEYLKFAEVMMDKQTVTINKSYRRLKGEDVITSPKTPKSKRTVKIPKFLCDEIQEYIKTLYDVCDNERIFTISKSYFHHEMDRGAKAAG